MIETAVKQEIFLATSCGYIDFDVNASVSIFTPSCTLKDDETQLVMLIA